MSKYETRKSAYEGTEDNAEKLQVRPCELADRKVDHWTIVNKVDRRREKNQKSSSN